MKKSYFLLAVSILLALPSFAQNIAINADGSLPNSNAILDVKSGNKGILIPRLDSVARKAIPNTKGLLVYDTTTSSFWYNTGSKWQNIVAGLVPLPVADSAWALTGNGNTVDGVNFLGTTNNVPLNIRVNNQPSGRIDAMKENAFWGYLAGSANNSGSFNTGIGTSSLQRNIAGDRNTAIGSWAMIYNISGYNNTAVGAYSMFENLTGYYNTALGEESLNQNTTGIDNTATGVDALHSSISGNANTAVGFQALYNSGGSNNTSVGTNSLLALTTGGNNTSVGTSSMQSLTTGGNNTSIGTNSLQSLSTGSNNTAIGFDANVSSGSFSNATAIGNGATVTASNKVRIGNSAVTVIEGQVPFTTPSDGRYKFNVQEDVKGLDFILQLRPVTYQFDVQRFDRQLNHQAAQEGQPANYAMQASYDEAARIRRSGFIAQEVEKAANATGYDFSGIIKPQTDQDHYSLSYDAFVVPLVKAVQEQQQIIDNQNKKLADLQRQLDDIKKLLQPATSHD